MMKWLRFTLLIALNVHFIQFTVSAPSPQAPSKSLTSFNRIYMLAMCTVHCEIQSSPENFDQILILENQFLTFTAEATTVAPSNPTASTQGTTTNAPPATATTSTSGSGTTSANQNPTTQPSNQTPATNPNTPTPNNQMPNQNNFMPPWAGNTGRWKEKSETNNS